VRVTFCLLSIDLLSFGILSNDIVPSSIDSQQLTTHKK
jgi:hypothetical protein